MNWKKITSQTDLETIRHLSEEQKVLIFKHSTRCSISAMALDRLERSWKEKETAGLIPCYLDLIAYRPLSNQIAEDFGVEHESPQVLIIEKGQCIYHSSHSAIRYQEILQQAGLVGA